MCRHCRYYFSNLVLLGKFENSTCLPFSVAKMSILLGLANRTTFKVKSCLCTFWLNSYFSGILFYQSILPSIHYTFSSQLFLLPYFGIDFRPDRCQLPIWRQFNTLANWYLLITCHSFLRIYTYIFHFIFWQKLYIGVPYHMVSNFRFIWCQLPVWRLTFYHMTCSFFYTLKRINYLTKIERYQAEEDNIKQRKHPQNIMCVFQRLSFYKENFL